MQKENPKRDNIISVLAYSRKNWGVVRGVRDVKIGN